MLNFFITLSHEGTMRNRKISSKTGLHDVSVLSDASFSNQQHDVDLITQLEDLDVVDGKGFKETSVPLEAKKSIR